MAACSTCKRPLNDRATPLGTAPGCEACGYAWFTEADIADFQQSVPRAFTPADLRRLHDAIDARKKASLERPVSYLSCPGCDRQLLRRTYGDRTFLLVHYCVEHGYWIHDDDMAGIADFVAHGGEILELQNTIARMHEYEQKLKIKNAALEKRVRAAANMVPIILAI